MSAGQPGLRGAALEGARLLALLGLLLGACVAPVSLEDRSCPCGVGWTCCELTQTCVARAELCPQPSQRPSTPEEEDGGTNHPPDAGDVDPEFASRCLDRHWCWENPSPHARYYQAVWASSPEDVWAVGAPGIATRWDGREWKVYRSATDQTLLALFGTGADDVWAVGRLGAVVRWNGKAWQPVATGLTQHLVAVWGSDPQDIWVAGFDGALLHWNGAEWTRPADVPRHYFTGLWGSASHDVWLISAEGAVWHWDGRAWSPQPGFTSDRVWSLSGAGGVLWALDQRIAAGTWRVLRFDGWGWSVVHEGKEPLTSLVGLSAQEAWAVGPDGGVLRIDAEGVAFGSLGIPEDLVHVWGTREWGLWMVGTDGQVLRRTDAEWRSLRVGASQPVLGGQALSEAEAWTCGEGGMLLRWSDGQWRSLVSGTDVPLHDVWGASPEEVWAVGGAGTIVRSDGASATLWPESLVAETLRGVWGTGPGDVWAVGDAGRILHYDGQRWSVSPSPTSAPLHRVWGTGAGSVWAVGGSGTVLRYDGSEWRTEFLNPSTPAALYGLWGSGPDDVWVVGENGLVKRYDGQRWSTVVPFAQGTLVDVWGTGPEDVYVLEIREKDTVLFHFDGKTWEPRTVPYGGRFNALWGLGKVPRIGGFGGSILRYRP